RLTGYGSGTPPKEAAGAGGEACAGAGAGADAEARALPAPFHALASSPPPQAAERSSPPASKTAPGTVRRIMPSILVPRPRPASEGPPSDHLTGAQSRGAAECRSRRRILARGRCPKVRLAKGGELEVPR